MTNNNPTKLDKIANEYVNKIIENNPIHATYMGIKDYDHLWPDFSPNGLEETNNIHTTYLNKAQNTETETQNDHITLKAMQERITLYQKLYETAEQHQTLNNIESPIQSIRNIFDLQPQETEEDFEKIIHRLENIHTPINQYIESLEYAKTQNKISPKRQIQAVIKQIQELQSQESAFQNLLQTHKTLNSSKQTQKLEEAINTAKNSFTQIREYLTQTLLPIAPEKDAVGRQRYELLSQYHVGAKVDLDETYEWGLEELNNIDKQQREIINELYGADTTLLQALDNLNNDPKYILHGTTALQNWMQKTADEAVTKLNGTHFDIDPRIIEIQCQIAPSSSGGIYYTEPSEDFSRPGSMWWSVPKGEEKFVTWQEKTTVYHEGVPGHHLQLGQTLCQGDRLNRWRKSLCWISGHGEGWALYAEQLMDELGYLNDLGDRMGMLDAQRLRASRVVLDIGVHLEKKAPAKYGDSNWDADIAWQFLKDNVAMSEAFLKFEWERYLGWAGQAPSYKIGQRVWLQIREDYINSMKSKGIVPDLKSFHEKALNIGSINLDLLRETLTN